METHVEGVRITSIFNMIVHAVAVKLACDPLAVF